MSSLCYISQETNKKFTKVETLYFRGLILNIGNKQQRFGLRVSKPNRLKILKLEPTEPLQRIQIVKSLNRDFMVRFSS